MVRVFMNIGEKKQHLDKNIFILYVMIQLK